MLRDGLRAVISLGLGVCITSFISPPYFPFDHIIGSRYLDGSPLFNVILPFFEVHGGHQELIFLSHVIPYTIASYLSFGYHLAFLMLFPTLFPHMSQGYWTLSPFHDEASMVLYMHGN